MLTEEQILSNKEEYISLIRQLKRPGCDVEDFISYLETTDFFTAPASTQYHCSFPGGLCQHSLNVYKSMLHLTNSFARKTVKNPKFEEGGEEPEFVKTPIYSKDSIILVGLLHDLNKINFYEMICKSTKQYCEDGAKEDELGKFNWITTRSYTVKNSETRETFGIKGITSYMIASTYFSLSNEETNAIMYQYSATSNGILPELSEILSRNNLAVFLHSADIIATYCIEK